MKEALLSKAQETRLQRRYQKLKEELRQLNWISQGSVINDRANAWRWTRKVQAKTVTLALSAPQAALYQQAIGEHRKLEVILREMRDISQRVLLGSAPGVRRRKRQPKHST
jgi:hypothetical protein